jgi:phospholipase C
MISSSSRSLSGKFSALLGRECPFKRKNALSVSALLGSGLWLAGPATAGELQTTPIQHVIIIMQENRSFDHYFGTFPGANGIPAGTCVPLDPSNPRENCVVPFHSALDVNAGGPHSAIDAQADLDDGVTDAKLDGFVHSQHLAAISGKNRCKLHPDNPECAGNKFGELQHDAVSYHTDAEIPNYWSYAKAFVLQDEMFEGVRSWSLPSHLEFTSLWTATCANQMRASSCATSPEPTKPSPHTTYPWVSLFQLLDSQNVSWKYYLSEGDEPDCENGEMNCEAKAQSGKTPSIWNPAPFFGYVKAQPAAYLPSRVQDVSNFLVDLKHGQLPTVSWIVPNNALSEHPPASITTGMEYVTTLVNAVMTSPYWESTVIYIAWDDWGGFYDHVIPPNVDRASGKTPIEGYGLRVPGMMISAWARPHMIDHAIYSFDAYATLIENLFLGGTRLSPSALGNPDNRPDLRDALTRVGLLGGGTAPVGNLMSEFDFTQQPLRPLILPTDIPTGLFATCGEDADRAFCKLPTVTLSWNAVTGAHEPAPYTYHVQRDGADLPQCTGTALTCSDAPGSGAHLYRIYSTDALGVASPLSAAAEIQQH